MTSKKDILTEVTAARDEARVRLHLLSMAARERWYELEAQLDNVEHRLHSSGEKVSDAILQRARELTKSALRLLEGPSERADLSTSARALMTASFRSCSPGQSLNQVFDVLHATAPGSVLVTDRDGKLVGMLSEHDVCEAVCSQDRCPSEMRVADAMSSPVYACLPEDTLSHILEVMRETQVHQLPVVDADRHALGVVTLNGIMRRITASPASTAGSAVLDALVAISAPGPTSYVTAAE
jgi:CBS domain-containing protein